MECLNSQPSIISTAMRPVCSTMPVRKRPGETEEENEHRLRDVERVFGAFMSPSSVTERLFFFTGCHRPADRIGDDEGQAPGGEDIGVLKLDIDEALTMVRTGAIGDAKTIMLPEGHPEHLPNSPT